MSPADNGGPDGAVAFDFADASDLAGLQVLAMQVVLDTYATAGIRPPG